MPYNLITIFVAIKIYVDIQYSLNPTLILPYAIISSIHEYCHSLSVQMIVVFIPILVLSLITMICYLLYSISSLTEVISNSCLYTFFSHFLSILLSFVVMITSIYSSHLTIDVIMISSTSELYFVSIVKDPS